MKTFLTLAAAFLFAAGFAACGDDHAGHDHGHDHGSEAHGDHDHDHDHEDGEDEGHGERVELGEAECGAFTLTVAVLGEITAGQEGVLDIEVDGGTPAAVRAWIGVESGQGSLKGKLDKEGDGYHGHVEVPATLAEDARVWIEVEGPDGKKSKASFELP